MPDEKEVKEGEVKTVEEKTPSQLRQEERDKIKVTTSSAASDAKEEDKEEDKDENKSDNDDEENNEDDGEDNESSSESETSKETSEDENKEEDKEEDDEEKDPKKIIAKLERKAARLEKRIGKETGANKDLKKELADVKKALEAKHAEGDEVYTKDEVEARAKEIAKQEREQAEFIQAGDKLAEGVEKVLKLDSKATDKKIAELVEAMESPIPGMMIYILNDIDNGSAVLAHLIKDHDEAERVWNLSAAKMTTELVKLGIKLGTPRPKDISKVPAPNDPVGGGRVRASFNAYDTKNQDDKTWIENRNAEVARKNAAKRGAMH